MNKSVVAQQQYNPNYAFGTSGKQQWKTARRLHDNEKVNDLNAAQCVAVAPHSQHTAYPNRAALPTAMPAALNYFNSNQQYQHHNKCISRSNSHAKTIKEHEQQLQHPQAKISLDLCSISDHMSGYNHRNNELVPHAAAAKEAH